MRWPASAGTRASRTPRATNCRLSAVPAETANRRGDRALPESRSPARSPRKLSEEIGSQPQESLPCTRGLRQFVASARGEFEGVMGADGRGPKVRLDIE